MPHPYILQNVLWSLTSSLLGQFLNYKAAEQEFKNPLLNGLQMAVMMSGTIEFFDKNGSCKQFNTKEKILSNNPILYGLAIAADDFLIDKLGWTSKHYLTDIVSSLDMYQVLKKFSPNQSNQFIAIGFLGLKWLREYYYNIDKGHIHALRDMQIKINQNIKNIEYVTDGLASLKMALIIQSLMSSSFNCLGKLINNMKAEEKGSLQMGKVILNVFMKNMHSNFVSDKAANIIREKNLKIFDSTASILKISSDTQHSQIFQNIGSISSYCNGSIRASLRVNSALQNFNQALTYSKESFALCNLINVINFLYPLVNNYDKNIELTKLQDNKSKISTDLMNNPRTVIERDGLNYFRHHSYKLNEKIKQLQDDIQQNESKAFFTLVLGFLLSYMSATIMNPGLLNYNWQHFNYNNFMKDYSKTLDIVLPLGDCYEEMLDLTQILENETKLQKLASFYKFLESVNNTSKVTYHSHDYENLKGLYLNNLNITINGVEKLHMDHLFLESSNWYLLTGKSGCGKTTLMSALRGLPNFAESIEISGNAFYPKATLDGKPQIYMLTQNNNFPYMVSIMEAILYPMITTEEERVSYKKLVEEIMLKMDGITRDSEDGKEYLESGLLSRLFEIENDIYSVTSGGQQKKMTLTGLIVRIMKETGMLDIYNNKIYEGFTHDQAMKIAKDSAGTVLVLIDEVFNGLDSGMSSAGFASSSKGYVMKALKESLPTKAIVVSVEHQAQIDQYTHRIHLNDDGTHTFTNPQTGAVESMESHDMRTIQSETFDPFDQISEDSADLICDHSISELENIQPLQEIIYVTAAA